MYELYNENDEMRTIFNENQERQFKYLIDLWKNFIEAYLAKDMETITAILYKEEVEVDRESKEQFYQIILRQQRLLSENNTGANTQGEMMKCACYSYDKRTFVASTTNSYYQFGFFPEFRRKGKLYIKMCTQYSNYDNVLMDDDFPF